MTHPLDPRFRVALIAATPSPQQCAYAAMHTDYSEGFVADVRKEWPDETHAGAICVKRLLAGERGHYGCYSADTEVLTESGWVFWPDVKPCHKLAAVHPKQGSITFETPSAIQVVDLKEGDHLYEVSSQKINFAVTLDHRMVVSTRKSNGSWTDWETKPAFKIIEKSVRYMLAGTLVGRSIPSDCPSVDLIAAFKLAGFFFGDGCRSKNENPITVRFKLRKKRKIDYLHSLGFDVKAGKDDRFTVNEPQLACWINKHFSGLTGKVIPAFIMHLPRHLFDAFTDGLMNSDGSLKRNTWCYDSKEKESLDILQAAFHLNGCLASLSLNNPNTGVGHENHAPCWRLHVSSRDPVARSEFNQLGRTRGQSGLVSYSGKVYCATVSTGALLVRRNGKPIVLGNCLEHTQIVLNVGWFPHSVMQQARTHRAGISFDVQSMRYTGDRICKAANGELDLEEVFYLRKPDLYRDRNGHVYEYTEAHRGDDLNLCRAAAGRYAGLIAQGFAEEHARGILPFDYRQHFVVSFTMRALMHFLDLRCKLDAQLEIRAMCDLMWPHFEEWAPQIAGWYQQHRRYKARLAP